MIEHFKIIAANAIATGNAVAQSTHLTGDQVRTWTSWLVAITVGILTIIKLIRDLLKNDND